MLAIFCLILLLSFSYDSVVDGKKEAPEKFRMEKINFIWSKAMNLLDKNTKRLEKLQVCVLQWLVMVSVYGREVTDLIWPKDYVRGVR